MNGNKKSIYLILSTNETIPEQIIKARAAFRFWNRTKGDKYAHIAIALDKDLKDMKSFNRKSMHNIFNVGLTKESLDEGMFNKRINVGKILVMEIKINDNQYVNIKSILDEYWRKKDRYKYNFLGLISMLTIARGIKCKDCFFCSEWIATILKEAEVHTFDGKKAHHIKPFDIYNTFKENVIYEGRTKEYLNLELISEYK